MKRKSVLYFLILLICGATLLTLRLLSSKPPIKFEGFAQGTTYHIHLIANHHTQPELKLIEQEIRDEFLRIDKSISNYRTDSDIEIFNAQKTTEPIETSEEIVSLIETARKINIASHGCYDLTIKPLFELWGFKRDQFHFPTATELAEAFSFIGMGQLETLDKNHLRKNNALLRVDLSSIGQGYSVSRISNILEGHQIFNYMVEIGGELKVKGKKAKGDAWSVAIEKPISTERKIEKIIRFVSGEPMSLMPSGTYHHFFDDHGKRYSHILDARTGKPIEHHTVMANAFLADSTQADAWSTALLCLGSEVGLKVADENHIAALFINEEFNEEFDKEPEKFIELKSKALIEMQGLVLEEPQSP